MRSLIVLFLFLSMTSVFSLNQNQKRIRSIEENPQTPPTQTYRKTTYYYQPYETYYYYPQQQPLYYQSPFGPGQLGVGAFTLTPSGLGLCLFCMG